MKVLILVAAAALTAYVVTGCGGTESASGAEGGQGSPGIASIPAEPSVTSKSTRPVQSSVTAPPTIVATEPYVAHGPGFSFKSPTGNVICGSNGDIGIDLGCQLLRVSSVPLELADCVSDSSNGVGVQFFNRKVAFICMRPSVGFSGGNPEIAVLPYGSTVVYDGIACTSTTSGIKCEMNGHGFTVSAESQRIF